jgi:chromosome segregation ATPase
MGTLWDQVFSLGQLRPREGRGVGPLETAAPARYTPDASLEAIGKQNETLRAQIEEVQHGFEHLEQVRGLFHGLLSPMSELLTEFAAAKARLHETKMKLTLVEDAHDGLNARYAAAVDERDLAADAKNALLRDHREMSQRVQRIEAALGETQVDLRECVNARDKAGRLLEIEMRTTASHVEEIRRLKEELSVKDQALANQELSLKVASDQSALLAQENTTLREASNGLAANLDAATRRIADFEAQADQSKHRLVAMEQALSEEQAAHAMLRARHVEHVERSHAEISTLGNTIHAVRGRVDVTNKILDQTRVQLREKMEELRAAERKLLESGIQIDVLEKGARSHKDDLDAANERIAGMERMRSSLVDQINGLNEAVRSKEGALQSAARTIEQLTARVDEMVAARQRAKEELDRRTASLQDEIARVRAERQLADGALEASRAERQQARRGQPVGGEPQREGADAGDAAQPAANNVTKLSRAAV